MVLLSTLLVLFFLVNCFETYHVNLSSDLEKYLCDTTWSSQHLVLSLNSSVNFTLSRGIFCQVTSNQTSKIDIRSDSLTEWATITCVHNDILEILPQSRRGLAFFNTTVTLERLIFKDCGTYLTTIQDSTITQYLNSSSLYYTSSHASALVFVHCQVNITQVNIYYSYGFAMIGVNLIDSTISEVNISYSSLSTNLYRHTEHKRRTIGCGAILHFFDHQLMIYPTNITVNYARFKNNFDLHKAYPYISKFSNNYLNIVNAAGLTVLYTQQTYFVSVIINNTELTSNVGSYNSPGGLLVLHYNSSVNTSTIVNNSLFSNNSNGPKSFLHGAALALYWIKVTDLSMTQHQFLLIQNTKFYDQTGHCHNCLPTGAVYVAVAELDKIVNIEIHFKNCTFKNNLVRRTGVCLFMSVYNNAKFSNISVVLEDINATNNSQKLRFKPVSTAGIFSFSNVAYVSITGMSTFTNNYGSVIDAFNSNVYLSKYANVTFSNNVGSRGAAIKLLGNGYLYFIGGAVVNFTNNRAQEFGGAIYASSAIKNSILLKEQCIIKLIKITEEKKISFTENVAIYAGNSIYAYPLFSCKFKQKFSNNRALLEFYRSHFHFIGNKKTNKLHTISTSASKLTLCYPNGTHRNSIKSINTYPGQKIKIYMASIDALSRNVYSTVAVNIDKKSNSLGLHNNQEQILNEGNNCTSFELKLYSKETNTTEGKLIFSLPSFPAALVVNVTVQHCPLGFVWHNKTQQCVCSSVFYNEDFYLVYGYKADCEIDYMSMARPRLSANTWAGYMNTSTHFGVSIQCPLGYCNGNGAFFCSSSTNNMTTSISKTCYKETLQTLCVYHREGPLCGTCGRVKEGQKLSVVFGSTECKQCSNWWLLTLVLYAIAGPLLIYLLYALRLTLTTGTLNGIIFYAHMANCGIIDLLSLQLYQEPYSKFCLIFLSTLNLNLGFPLCFYDGMTELWKAGLSLLFPFYLLTIVVVLIILSHFYVRLSNRIAHSSVQVLVTVVHLSFSKLLLAIIDVFTSARIYYDSDSSFKVWYWDGSIQYGSGSHLILMIITLVIVISLLLPYVLILIFARPIRRTSINKYIRPLLEAIHAPYNEGKEYLFVARLVFLVGICVIYASLRARNVLNVYIITSPFLVILLLLHVHFKPFKNKVIYFLDCWLMFNIILIYTTTWFFFIEGKNLAIAVFVSVMVCMVFLTFLVILLYHILLVTGKIYSITTMFYLMQHKYKQKMLSYKPLLAANDSFYNSCEYREPLLNSSN